MEIHEAKEIAEKFDKKLIYNDAKVDEFIRQYAKSTNDRLLLLTSVVKPVDSLPAFSMNDLILRYRAKNEWYTEFITELAKKKSSSIFQLPELWEIDPEIAEYTYHNLNQKNDERLARAMGFTLQGLARKNQKRLFQMINNNIEQSSTAQRIAYTIALQGIERNQEIPSCLVDFVILNSDSENRVLKETAIYALMIRLSSYIKVTRKLEDLCHTNDNDTVRFISLNSISISRESKELVLRLLTICAKNRNLDVLSHVSFGLGAIAKDYPIECLNLAKNWIKSNPSGRGFKSIYLLNQIGEADHKKIVKFMSKWVHDEKDDSILEYDIPELLVGIFEKHHEHILDFIDTLDRRLRRNKILIIKTLKKMLSDQYKEIDKNGRFAHESFDILSRIASRRGLNIQKIVKGEQNIVMKSLMIIYAIIEYEIQVSYGIDLRKALTGLKYFPGVVSFFKCSAWFAESIKKKKDPHPLTLFLARAALSERKKTKNDYPYLLMCDIEKCLGEFGKAESGIKHLRDGMKNPDQFFQTLSELQIASRLKRRFPVDFEPKIGNKKLDIGVTIDNKDLLIEIITLTMDSKLRYIGLVADMPNKAKEKIVEEISKQLREVSLYTDNPIIMAIDITDAPDISSIDIVDAIYGSTQLTLVSEKESRKIIRTFPSRKDDSISDEPNEGKIISAVIVLRRVQSFSNNRIELTGELFVNPRANIPMDDNTRRILTETILQ
jgi:hypothetical protein